MRCLADLSGFQFCSHLLPCMKRCEQMLIFFMFSVKPETKFSVNFSDLYAIHIFQSKECVHETKIGVNVWNIDCPWTDIEDMSYFFDQFNLWSSGFRLVLCYTNIASFSSSATSFFRIIFFFISTGLLKYNSLICYLSFCQLEE